jgi:hypothetical protein
MNFSFGNIADPDPGAVPFSLLDPDPKKFLRIPEPHIQ